ncbi:hypothetical protein RZO55_24595 [Clostridium boliviensis]|uniref:Uncharacterized protein n=1 Tax=Clostridium boliviensis TaxID=318465 RepID=A0ABU4GSX8_9CLOT|nr:hypothetical protein [Clostridium boliviensis]MDW2800754.1 hypothetical protein [Clostridium boliviensis]
MNKHLLGFYNYTVILTYSGMLIAFLGIYAIPSNNYFKIRNWLLNIRMAPV